MDNLKTVRDEFDLKGKLYTPADLIECKHDTIAGINCYWYGQLSHDCTEVLVYVHGGGFFLGSHHSHGAWTSNLAHSLNRPVAFAEYSLAPENPFPTALHEVANFINQVQQRYPSAKIGLIGDSAGGNIALSSGIHLKDSGLKQPDCYMLYSPWLDLECKNAAFERNRSLDSDLTLEGLRECARMYANGHSLQDPLLSPINANLEGLNPVLIMCGTNEILEDDSLILHKRLKESAVQTTFESFSDEGHSWSYYDVHSEASIKSFELLKRFLEECF